MGVITVGHRVIGGILLVLLAVALVLIGVFLVGHLVDFVAPQKRGRLLVLWGVAFLILAVPQYYLDNYMSDGQTRYWAMVAGNWPVYVMFLSGWLASFMRRRHKAKGSESGTA